MSFPTVKQHEIIMTALGAIIILGYFSGIVIGIVALITMTGGG